VSIDAALTGVTSTSSAESSVGVGGDSKTKGPTAFDLALEEVQDAIDLLPMWENYEQTRASFEEAATEKAKGLSDARIELATWESDTKKEIWEEELKAAQKKDADDAARLQAQLDRDKSRIMSAKEVAVETLAASANLAGGISAILKQTAGEDKKAKNQAKAFAIGEAVINGALAAVKIAQSFSGMGPAAPALIALNIAGIAAITAANVIAIKNQKFAHGGIVGGSSFSGDRVQASLNSGEMILNRDQQANLFAALTRPSSSLRGGVTIGGDTIIINGNADQRTVEALRKTRIDQLEALRRDIRELEYTGRI
jgi:hypothetical protein